MQTSASQLFHLVKRHCNVIPDDNITILRGYWISLCDPEDYLESLYLLTWYRNREAGFIHMLVVNDSGEFESKNLKKIDSYGDWQNYILNELKYSYMPDGGYTSTQDSKLSLEEITDLIEGYVPAKKEMIIECLNRLNAPRVVLHDLMETEE